MSTGATILDMTPIKRVVKTLYYWTCQRKQCKHEWLAKDPDHPPKRCAKCKRLDWNRKTLPVGRPRKSGQSSRTRNRSRKGK